MNVNLGIWSKLSKLILVLIIASGGVAVAVWYLPLIQRNENLRRNIIALEDSVRKQEARLMEIRAQIASMKDKRTIERIARQRMNYARPGETVIRFETADPNPPPLR